MKIQLKIIFCFISISLFISLGCKSNLPNKISNTDTLVHSKKSNVLKTIDTISIKSKKQFIGTWLDLGKEELTLDINSKFFYYREHHEKVNYKFERDTIRIFYREFVMIGKPSFIGDTLVIFDSNGYAFKYLKIKEK